MTSLGKAGLASLNAGGGAGGNVGGGTDTAVRDEVAGLRQEMADWNRLLPKLIRDAVMLAPRRAA